MEAKATWIRGSRIDLETQGSVFPADVCRVESEGKCPPSAVDYLTASFAGCVAYFVAKALQNRGVEPKGLKVLARGDYAEGPHRIGSFHLEVDLPENLSEPLKAAARRAAEGCTIHHTLTHPPTIHFEYHSPPAEGKAPIPTD